MSLQRNAVFIGLAAVAILIVAILFHSWQRSELPRVESPFTSSPKSTPPQNLPPSEEQGAAPNRSSSPPIHRTRLIAPQEVDGLVREFCPKHRQARQSGGEGLDRYFKAQKTFYYREARLLALAFPEATERAATSIALDPNAEALERAYCISMLSVIGKTLKPGGVLATLETLTHDKKGQGILRDSALAAIAASDHGSEYKGLFWEACREGSATAFNIASTWVDPGTIGEMKAILARQQNYMAESVLKRMEMMTSPTWESQLSRILGDPNEEDPTALQWALNVAKDRNLQNMLPVLRSRLDKGFQEAQKGWSVTGAPSPGSFEEAYTTEAEWADRTQDPKYDNILVAYWMAGGALSDRERARLRTFGFVCDPKERLGELLTSGK